MGHDRVFITGGSGGIGSACIRELTGRSWRVVAPSEKECDVRHLDDVRRAMGQAQIDMGGIDAVVNCAGIRDGFADDVVNTNLLGALNVGSEAMRRLETGGRLVLIASVSAITPAPGRAAYAASKAGVRAIASSLRKERRLFRVSTIILGATDTLIWTDADTYPREKMLRPADVADAVAWILDRPPGVSVDELVLVPQDPEVRPPGW